MGNNNFLGGFIGTSNGLIKEGVTPSPGQYNDGDAFKMSESGSWPQYIGDTGIGTYINRTTSSSGSIEIPSGAAYVFVSLAGGGGSGAHDNDCRNQGPGGSGGAGKSLVYLSSTGSTTINYSIGAGGPGVAGNDASGRGGGGSSINIGNFNLTANGGSGGPSSNNSTAPSGNAAANGPYTLFSTSSVFASTVVTGKETAGIYNYVSMPTSASGSGGRCGEGGSSSPGTPGFLYIRYGGGINENSTLTPGADPPSSGPTQAYTPS